MNKSLQDQLLGAGLVDAKKAKKISKETRKENKIAHKSKHADISEAKAATLKAKQEKVEHDRALNRLRQLEMEKKALAAQIAQLVEHYKLSRLGAELDYNFTDGKLIKKIRVAPGMSEELVRGRLCIARVGDVYEVIPKPIAEKIRERDTAAVVVFNASTGNDMPAAKDDDYYYAQFEIPDDLMW
jgi:uncharacterized protein YaiL (DUF2058 family)